VFFLDVRMPDMSGFEFLDEYDRLELDNDNAVKIYMLSSSLDPIDVSNSTKSRHVAQFIHKPLTYEALEELNT